MYDGILKLDLPEGTTLVGYADDIALVAVAKHLDTLQALCNDAISRVQRWLRRAKLELADHKTELVLLSTRRRYEELTITVGDHNITSQPYIKYFGVLIDSRMTFKQHLQSVSDKATRINSALWKIMPNIGGPRSSIRHLLSTVTSSVILYAAPIWAHTKKTYLKDVQATYRIGALRVASAYRTVSNDAICVIAGKVPIDLLAEEMERLYSDSARRPSSAAKQEEREKTIAEWQRRWEQSEKGRWTFQLIPEVATWINRKHGEVDYDTTQLLTGHGCFKEYLHRFKIEDDPYCSHCPEQRESASHVLFHCPRFENERQTLCAAFNEYPKESNLVQHMCESKQKWDTTGVVATIIMKELRRTEFSRRSTVGQN